MANRCSLRMFVHSPALQHQVGSQQPGFRRQETPDQCAGDLVGRLATTRNGRRGHRKASRSASATRTSSSANRERRCRARPGCSSTASTLAPAATRCAVSAPCPAPRSTTNSPERTPDSATIRAAQSSVSGYQPHWRRDRWPDTTQHHHEYAHAPKISGHATGFDRSRRRPRSP